MPHGRERSRSWRRPRGSVRTLSRPKTPLQSLENHLPWRRRDPMVRQGQTASPARRRLRSGRCDPSIRPRARAAAHQGGRRGSEFRWLLCLVGLVPPRGEERGDGAHGDDGGADVEGGRDAVDEGVAGVVAAVAREERGQHGDAEYSAELTDRIVGSRRPTLPVRLDRGEATFGDRYEVHRHARIGIAVQDRIRGPDCRGGALHGLEERERTKPEAVSLSIRSRSTARFCRLSRREIDSPGSQDRGGGAVWVGSLGRKPATLWRKEARAVRAAATTANPKAFP